MNNLRSVSLGKSLLKVFSYLLNKFESFTIFFTRDVHGSQNANSQIFSHETIFNAFDYTCFKSFTEMIKFFIFIKFGSMEKTSCPSENTSNRVG